MGADLYAMRDTWARLVWKQWPVLKELPLLQELARQLEEEARQRQAEYERRCAPGPLGCYSLEDPDPYKDPADRMTADKVDRDRSVDEYNVLVEFYRRRWGGNICVKGLGDNRQPFTNRTV
jgi:hypothetical protein